MYYIYKLFFNTVDDFYIGVTCDYERRKKEHLNHINKNYKNTRIYNFIKSNNLLDDVQFKKLKVFKCDNLKEAKKIERCFIEALTPSLNVCIPLRTNTEYFNDNKSEIYRKRNIKNLQKREIHKKKSLKYYYDNKEDRRKKHLEYLKSEKGKIATENRYRPIVCLCGCQMSFSSHRYHKKTIKHNKEFLKNILESKQRLKHSFKNIDIRL